MRLSSPIYKLKRQAKLQARTSGIKLHAALDQIAKTEGFASWSHLASTNAKTTPASDILHCLNAGDMVLIAARPGHGKTLLALELVALAEKINRAGYVFTLDDTATDVSGRFASLGFEPDGFQTPVVIDTSDTICATHIIDRLGASPDGALVVVDYLQLLDQKRSNPPLDVQLHALKAYAVAHGTIVVMIAQIDRAFERSSSARPRLADVRLPNPVDLSLFDKRCFLHDGDIQVEIAA